MSVTDPVRGLDCTISGFKHKLFPHFPSGNPKHDIAEYLKKIFNSDENTRKKVGFLIFPFSVIVQDLSLTTFHTSA